MYLLGIIRLFYMILNSFALDIRVFPMETALWKVDDSLEMDISYGLEHK